jgi:hypothetical protein
MGGVSEEVVNARPVTVGMPKRKGVSEL